MTNEELWSFSLWLRNRGREDLCPSGNGDEAMAFASRVADLVKKGVTLKQISELCDLWEQWKKEWVESL